MLMILESLIAPLSVFSFRTGRTLLKYTSQLMLPYRHRHRTYSGGFAGSMMTASFDLSSVTR